jgi:RNA polymerase sigma-70 factor (ECF subfamily)
MDGAGIRTGLSGSPIHMVTNSYTKPLAMTSSDNIAAIDFRALGSALKPVVAIESRPLWQTLIGTSKPKFLVFDAMRPLTRDLIAADDLVQDCLTRALGKLHLWQQGTDLRAWLFTILHNQYINHVRRTAREGAAVGLSEREPLLARAPQQGRRLELRDLDRAITKLPRVQRSVTLLVGLEGMSYGEVAAVLDVPVGTVRSRLSRGREALRQLTGISHAGEADTVMAGLTGRNRPIQRFDGTAGRSDIAVNRGRRVAGRPNKRASAVRYPGEQRTNGHRAA